MGTSGVDTGGVGTDVQDRHLNSRERGENHETLAKGEGDGRDLKTFENGNDGVGHASGVVDGAGK